MNDYLKNLKSIEEKATAGPWRTYDSVNKDGDWPYGEVFGPKPAEILGDRLIVGCGVDARFIAASRTAIPKLIEACEVMRRQIENYIETQKELGLQSYSQMEFEEALARVEEILKK